MSNLEHFIENGLMLMESGEITPEEWSARMSSDPNVSYVALSVEDLWTICQYILYSYKLNSNLAEIICGGEK